MKSKWKSINYPSMCFRGSFLKCFQKNIITKNNDKIIRITRDNNISVGSCKKFRLFEKTIGHSFDVWSGNKHNIIQVTPAMVKMFLGSFVFTKRFTKEIHKKQVQARHKRAFGKKK